LKVKNEKVDVVQMGKPVDLLNFLRL